MWSKYSYLLSLFFIVILFEFNATKLVMYATLIFIVIINMFCQLELRQLKSKPSRINLIEHYDQYMAIYNAPLVKASSFINLVYNFSNNHQFRELIKVCVREKDIACAKCFYRVDSHDNNVYTLRNVSPDSIQTAYYLMLYNALQPSELQTNHLLEGWYTIELTYYSGQKELFDPIKLTHVPVMRLHKAIRYFAKSLSNKNINIEVCLKSNLNSGGGTSDANLSVHATNLTVVAPNGEASNNEAKGLSAMADHYIVLEHRTALTERSLSLRLGDMVQLGKYPRSMEHCNRFPVIEPGIPYHLIGIGPISFEFRGGTQFFDKFNFK